MDGDPAHRSNQKRIPTDRFIQTGKIDVELALLSEAAGYLSLRIDNSVMMAKFG